MINFGDYKVVVLSQCSQFADITPTELEYGPVEEVEETLGIEIYDESGIVVSLSGNELPGNTVDEREVVVEVILNNEMKKNGYVWMKKAHLKNLYDYAIELIEDKNVFKNTKTGNWITQRLVLIRDAAIEEMNKDYEEILGTSVYGKHEGNILFCSDYINEVYTSLENEEITDWIKYKENTELGYIEFALNMKSILQEYAGKNIGVVDENKDTINFSLLLVKGASLSKEVVSLLNPYLFVDDKCEPEYRKVPLEVHSVVEKYVDFFNEMNKNTEKFIQINY